MAMTCLWGNQQLDHDQMRSVISYYDSTWLDYRWLWLNDENHAIHFGYHDGLPRSHAESLLNTNRVLAETAAVQRGDRVLDAGCGVAGSGIWLAEQRGATVVGITPVRTQVKRARHIITMRGLADAVPSSMATTSPHLLQTPASTSSGRSRACATRGQKRRSIARAHACCDQAAA
jgi:cyclopropane fatty-acyl-phospholipid synthase-like methyltransferase